MKYEPRIETQGVSTRSLQQLATLGTALKGSRSESWRLHKGLRGQEHATNTLEKRVDDIQMRYHGVAG